MKDAGPEGQLTASIKRANALPDSSYVLAGGAVLLQPSERRRVNILVSCTYKGPVDESSIAALNSFLEDGNNS